MNCIQVDNAIKGNPLMLGKCLSSTEKYFSQMKQSLMEERCVSPFLKWDFQFWKSNRSVQEITLEPYWSSDCITQYVFLSSRRVI